MDITMQYMFDILGLKINKIHYNILKQIIEDDTLLYNKSTNSLFLDKEHDKTLKSYCLAFTQLKEALEDKDINTVEIYRFSKDLQDAQKWFKGFKEFLKQYYETVGLNIYIPYIDKLVYRKV